MKKIIFLFIVAGLAFQSCSDSFLDTKNLTKKDSSSFPVNETDAYAVLMSIFNKAKYRDWFDNPYTLAELMSDDRFGGGGPHDIATQAINAFKITSGEHHVNAWKNAYAAINRANFLIEAINTENQIEWTTPNMKDKIEGNAYFLRALCYFDLARLYERVPLLISTFDSDLTQVTPEAIYGQIAADLLHAINIFPDTPYPQIPKGEYGLATKWTAEGYLARVFLFYSGYYDQTSITMPDGTLTKQQVIDYTDDCIENSGHSLVPDFRNIWPYSASNKDYKYAVDNNLEWVGEAGENPETVFAFLYNGLGVWGWSNNLPLLAMGLRQDAFPFGKGWGVGPVNSQLFDQWPDNDLRKIGSIYSEVLEPAGHNSSVDHQYAETTRMWNKKNMPISMKDADGNIVTLSSYLYGARNDFNNCISQDLIVLRFADILLMGAELGSSNAQNYLDRVRSRVNLPSVPVNLENIKKERRYELAFEGVRYFDLLRWHDAEEAYAQVKNVPAFTATNPVTVSVNYRPATRGFLPIPQSEIELSNGLIQQNPGWDTPEAHW